MSTPKKLLELATSKSCKVEKVRFKFQGQFIGYGYDVTKQYTTPSFNDYTAIQFTIEPCSYRGLGFILKKYYLNYDYPKLSYCKNMWEVYREIADFERPIPHTGYVR